MRGCATLLVLMLLTPVSAAMADDARQSIDLEIDGEPILPTYSRAVQAAFARVEKIGRAHV